MLSWVPGEGTWRLHSLLFRWIAWGKTNAYSHFCILIFFPWKQKFSSDFCWLVKADINVGFSQQWRDAKQTSKKQRLPVPKFLFLETLVLDRILWHHIHEFSFTPTFPTSIGLIIQTVCLWRKDWVINKGGWVWVLQSVLCHWIGVLP